MLLVGLSILILGLGYKIFKSLNWLDNPQKYGFDRDPVPYSFGLVVFVCFLVGLLWSLNFSDVMLSESSTVKLMYFVLASAGLVMMSFVDDRIGLSPFVRFVGQVVCASIVVLGGGVVIYEISLPLELGVVKLGFLGYVFSVVWIVLITNLMNFLDGVSALSSAVSFNGFLFLVGLAALPAVHMVEQNLVVLIGSIMAFLAFVSMLLEFEKPKVLIGDSGVMWFGFALAVLSMINGGKLATLGLVLIVPILDGLMIILLRILNLKKPWQGDFNHLHHLLIRHGWSRRKIVVMYFVFSMFLGSVAVLFWNSVMKFLILGLSIIGLITVILLIQKKYGDWSK